MYATKEKGVRYLEMAEGYVTGIALDRCCSGVSEVDL